MIEIQTICSNCDKKLLLVYVTEGQSDLYVDCPFCGDKSWRYPSIKTFRVEGSSKLEMIDVEMDDKTILIKTRKK